MLRRALLCALTLSLVTAVPAIASPRPHHDDHRHHSLATRSDFDRDGRGDQYDSEDDSNNNSDDTGGDEGDSGSTDTGSDVTVPEVGVQALLGGTVASGTGKVLSGTARTVQVETTSYNFADNAGADNATICCEILHSTASGDGSYQNPITLAVPGSGGKGMQDPPGTRVYFVRYAFYGIVEDSGASPKTLKRYDIWSDGRGLSKSAGEACMSALTGTSTAIINPPPGKPVAHVGPRGDASGCHVAPNGS